MHVDVVQLWPEYAVHCSVPPHVSQGYVPTCRHDKDLTLHQRPDQQPPQKANKPYNSGFMEPLKKTKKKAFGSLKIFGEKI